jgi:ribonuclease P protein component
VKVISIKENHIFRRLYAKGKSAVSPCLALYCRRNGRDHSRLGITVSAKLGKAVRRNKIRRRIREIYRIHQEEFLPGWDIVVVARVKAAHSSYAALERSFLTTADKLALRRKELPK